MMFAVRCSLLAVGLCLFASYAHAQDRVHYTGTQLSDPNRHDGGLSPVVGVHSVQIMRANRAKPMATNGNSWSEVGEEYTDGYWKGDFDNTDSPYTSAGNGWTYNHQPMMAYWHGRFFVHYLSDPVDEHVPPSATFIQTSDDGYAWSNPQVLFPVYRVPDGYSKDGRVVAHDVDAVMHQRVGFYVAGNDRLLAIGNYGVALYPKDDPNDGNGIGRVVREIYDDGSFGPIYFIYYNHAFNESNTDYPYYTRSRDKGFREACDELLANPLQRMGWVEEADRDDPLIPLHQEYKAFCWYTLPDGRIACLWKHALTSISSDGGNTWDEPIGRARGFVNSNAKIWGQRLSDGTYATVYNPSEFRWPLAISLSEDGLNYTTLNLVFGEVPPMRYAGQYKSYGPQYVRGIQEGNGTPPDGDLWVTYSVNKEDIWVSRIPVPVEMQAKSHAADDFSAFSSVSELTMWNLMSGVWTPISLEEKEGTTWLTLSDKDPFLDARAERIIPCSRLLTAEFDLLAEQADHGMLQIEFVDGEGTACARLDLTAEGELRSKSGARYGRVCTYEPGKKYHLRVDIDLDNRNSTVYVDGKKRSTRMLFAPLADVERIVFRTGERRTEPTVDTPADQYSDAAEPNREAPKAVFRIANLSTRSSSPTPQAAILNYGDYSRLVDEFNAMEDENIVQAIPNAQASDWMAANVPLFDCPQQQFVQIYYFRWWSLRKHIELTPVGYAMTEFLVPRTYADRYNLISSALGHHISETRWLLDGSYSSDLIRTWYRGNEGKPMAKMMNYSSWAPYAVYGRYLADGDLTFLSDLYPDLKAEYARWKDTHRLPSGLYWQSDVNDAMEESISGGRKKQYARPSINSYMFGNAWALAQMARALGHDEEALVYERDAAELKRLVEDKLWHSEHRFFETLRGDSLADVREAIGFLPYYFGLIDDLAYAVAWEQIEDEEGFSAPRGLTTAERRHPDFRSHGVGRCEWDGAIWPFATSQTLTALANYLNSTDSAVVSRDTYFRQMELYVECQYHRGRPYIGEYLDEVTGYWLKGDQERSRYYNHSTFADLVITGLIGLRPRADRVIEVNPLVSAARWSYFCLDRLPYHGHLLTIVYDATGSHYHHGKGLQLLVDGRVVARSDRLERIVYSE